MARGADLERQEQRRRNRPRLGEQDRARRRWRRCCGRRAPPDRGGPAADCRGAAPRRTAAGDPARRRAARARVRHVLHQRRVRMRATRRTSPTSPSRRRARPVSPSARPGPSSAPPARRRRSRRPRRGSTSASTARRSTSCSISSPGSPPVTIRRIAPRTFSSSTWRRSSGRTAAGTAAASLVRQSRTATSRGPRWPIRALTSYAPPGRIPEMQERVRRATAWLRAAKPITVEDRAFRLLGLTWGGAEADVRREAAKELVALQRLTVDGVSAPRWQADAYATGLAIYALEGERQRAAVGRRRSRQPVPAVQRSAPTAPGTCAADPPSSSRTSTAGSPTSTISGFRRWRPGGRRRRWR